MASWLGGTRKHPAVVPRPASRAGWPGPPELMLIPLPDVFSPYSRFTGKEFANTQESKRELSLEPGMTVVYLWADQSPKEGMPGMDKKQEWAAPELTVLGTVEELTQGPKYKQFGTSDDFGISGISDA